MWTHDLLSPPRTRTRRGHRDLAAQVLRGASRVLDALAARLAPAPDATRTAPADPWLEFHAEAGAPEGALYVNGELVGHIAGVQRL